MFANYSAASSSTISQLEAARLGLEDLLKVAGGSDLVNINTALVRQKDLENQARTANANDADYMARLQAAVDKQLQQVSDLNKAVYTGAGTVKPNVSRVTSLITKSSSGIQSTGGAIKTVPSMPSFMQSDTIFGMNKWLVYGLGGLTVAALITLIVPRKSTATVV